jgi:hypothetical protein
VACINNLNVKTEDTTAEIQGNISEENKFKEGCV